MSTPSRSAAIKSALLLAALALRQRVRLRKSAHAAYAAAEAGAAGAALRSAHIPYGLP
ncbi:MAG TPA: hypothetical protein VGX16_01660 [Solirubrobacteraceae bacterium]|jgi:hypothetical protein|nr:hypothetical protein [Solirubrobacteraceae bacterium]